MGKFRSTRLTRSERREARVGGRRARKAQSTRNRVQSNRAWKRDHSTTEAL